MIMRGLQSENYLTLPQVFGVVFLRMLKDKILCACIS